MEKGDLERKDTPNTVVIKQNNNKIFGFKNLHK